MENNINRKSILLAVAIVMMGLLVVSGTYAYLLVTVNVVNGNYVTGTHCFQVVYGNDTNSITGTLFPTASAVKGLNGKISATTDVGCDVTTGRGTLKMHVDSATSTDLTATVAGHCEVENTLETLTGYDSSSSCGTAGGIWVTTGSALKYAVFIGNDLYNSGYITSSDIGDDIILHDDFSVTSAGKNFDIYIWLDGYLSEDYYNLPFAGYINIYTEQVKSTDTTFLGDTPLSTGYLSSVQTHQMDFFYQRVEYIQSSGTQYINTGYYPNHNTRVFTDYQYTSLTKQQRLFGADNNTSSADISYSVYINGSTKFAYAYNNGKGNWVSTNVSANTNRHTIDLNNSGRVLIDNGSTFNNAISGTLTMTSSYPMYILAKNNLGTADYFSSAKIYKFVIYEGNNMLMNFIPCKRRSDDVVGLCDVANGNFYSNAAASGSDFTAGPNVS